VATDVTRYGPWAVIAGASEGIGEHAARQLAADGFSLVLVSRRIEVLRALADSILDGTHGIEVRCVALDLGQEHAAPELGAQLAGLEVGLVFYNAGADTGPRELVDRDPEDLRSMICRNVQTPTLLLRQLGAQMRARGRGGIVIIGSMAGVSGSALIATYAATKAYQHVLGEGLWRELRPYGVDVVTVVAGATATPAHERTGAVTSRDYPPMQPDDVARNALAQLGRGPIQGASDELTATFHALRGLPREQVIDMMSAGTRAIHALGPEH
jgi:short-subunit dehydrogenase